VKNKTSVICQTNKRKCLSFVYLSMINMCVYKKNRIEFYRDGYSCHMNDITAVIRKNQYFCVGKAIAIRMYAMFLLLFVYIFTSFENPFIKMRGLLSLFLRPPKVIFHGFLRLRICGKR